VSLRSRVERLERDTEVMRHGRTVIVAPSEMPGSIVPIDATTWHLYVPEADGLDPVAGLSD
jgi:hypothetical protein